MTKITAKKMSYIVNSVLLVFVLGLLGFFFACKASILIYFSIPTILVYLVNYVLIWNNKLRVYIWLVYFWIAFYMSLTTVCLGFHLGFHLYSMSMIPVLFCTDYMGIRLYDNTVHPVGISIGIGIIYIISTVTAIWNGPIYLIEKKLAIGILVCNCLVVFGFIIFYTHMLLGMVIHFEQKLTKMAHVDKLTDLFNRHYMFEQLSNVFKEQNKKSWIAMLDIDDFKKINDTYGHSGGDYVLVHISELMKEICENCIISRWGGEEFLILADKDIIDMSLIDKLREKITEKPFLFEENEITVTVSGGIANLGENQSIDSWIIEADEKLYYAKSHGKNQITK